MSTSSSKPQPFLGTIAAAAATKVATSAIERVAEKVMKKPSTPVENKDAKVVAEAVAVEAAPAVIEELKQHPKLGVALNAEPLWKSKNLWLGIATCFSAFGGMGTLYFNGVPDGMDAYSALLVTFFTGVGMIARRVSLQV